MFSKPGNFDNFCMVMLHGAGQRWVLVNQRSDKMHMNSKGPFIMDVKGGSSDSSPKADILREVAWI